VTVIMLSRGTLEIQRNYSLEDWERWLER